MNYCEETVVRRRRVILLVSKRGEADFAYEVLRLGAQVSYEIQHRKIIESIEMKLVF
jgi:hypothetical protein